MIKLSQITRRGGKRELVIKDLPDIDEAKRLWREGKSAQQIIEQHQKRKKGKDEDS